LKLRVGLQLHSHQCCQSQDLKRVTRRGRESLEHGGLFILLAESRAGYRSAAGLNKPLGHKNEHPLDTLQCGDSKLE
jgi:hypothetical protein